LTLVNQIAREGIMRRTSRGAVVAISIAVAWTAMSGARVDAQPAATMSGQSPFPSQTSVATGGRAADPTQRRWLFDRNFTVAAAPGAEQGAAQTPNGRDSVLNGVLIGAGIGALLGLIPDHYDDCEECHDSLYASIAVGAGIGLIVDLLRTGTQSVSPSRSAGGLRVDIAAGRSAVGVRGSVRWR
jgi:hypothetical protein